MRPNGRVRCSRRTSGNQSLAGWQPRRLDPASENVDLSEAYAKPLVPEVLEAADVAVTMGRSVGAVTIPDGVRHEDWRVGDPTGAPVEEVRRVRDDIDRRVQALLAEIEAG